LVRATVDKTTWSKVRVADSRRAGNTMLSFCRSKYFKNYLQDFAAESCSRAINLTAAFTTHFPEGLLDVSSQEVFPQHICLVFVACCVLQSVIRLFTIAVLWEECFKILTI